jgi:hypothetical protein
MAHGGAENGKLPITYVDFEKWGVRPDSIAGAIRALEALGLIEITRHGYAGAAEKRAPSLYRLTYVAAWNAGRNDATGTHEYQNIKSIDDADRIARTARKASDPHNVLRGKTKKATPQIGETSAHKLWSEITNPRPTKSGLHTSPPNCGVLSISREGVGLSMPLAKRALRGACSRIVAGISPNEEQSATLARSPRQANDSGDIPTRKRISRLNGRHASST